MNQTQISGFKDISTDATTEKRKKNLFLQTILLHKDLSKTKREVSPNFSPGKDQRMTM
jgi:hypothetical protein